MPCWQSWLAIVPPPAPEPTTTTQSRSSWSIGFEAIGKALPAPCPFVDAMSARLLDPRLGEPVEVVEASGDIATLAVRGALPAQEPPDLRVVVEGQDRLRPHRLEEDGRAHAAQHVERLLVREPLERRAAGGVEVAQALVELGAQPDVLGGCLQDRVGRALVGAVGEAVVGEHDAHHARQQRPLGRLDPGAGHRGHGGLPPCGSPTRGHEPAPYEMTLTRSPPVGQAPAATAPTVTATPPSSASPEQAWQPPPACRVRAARPRAGPGGRG